jgi:hypothetical protein
MRTLVIPDIHHRTDHADYWLATQRHDRVVFLGDYFDNFGDDVGDARRTARWLRDRVEDAGDHVFLLGNHDAAYMFPDKDELYCPGFTKAKSRGIHEILKAEHWARFKLAHEEQGWLFSHAGFHPVWMKEPTVERIVRRCCAAMTKAKKRIVDPILGMGEDRGGLQRFGGPLWMDWGSLIPIAGINQIVGHTPDALVREKKGRRSRNYCIDVDNASAAAIIEDGGIEIVVLPE